MISGIIENNIAEVKGRIAEAAKVAGKSFQEITLVAVCKYFDASVTQAVVDAGLLDLGENRPQQLWEKAETLHGQGIRWHQIGHLQRNKVRRTLPLITLMHAADSLRLLREVSKQAVRIEKEQDVLVEVNISGDENKHGFKPEEMESVLNECEQMAGIKVRGLMAMAGLGSGLDGARREFEQMRLLQERLLTVKPDGIELRELSMGMSRDYDIAIEQGATMVRVGNSLFNGIER